MDNRSKNVFVVVILLYMGILILFGCIGVITGLFTFDEWIFCYIAGIFNSIQEWLVGMRVMLAGGIVGLIYWLFMKLSIAIGKREKNMLEKRYHLIPSIIASIMLFLAMAPCPYGYYQLLRFVVCGAAVYVAVTAYSWQKMWAAWLFGFIAILFNPLIPVHLSRELWQPIDLISAILFLVAVLILKKPPEVNKTDKEFEKFAEVADRIVERHNKYGVTLTDPRTGQDLLADMTGEQREKYRQFKIETSRARQEEKGV
jgi:hypothetical protein